MFKILSPLFFLALVLSSCKEKGATPATTSSTGSDAALKTITLGAENFNLTVPEAGATAILNNAPRTIQSVITAVPVNITAADNAAISKGGAAFTSGAVVDFSKPVTFTVTAPDGTAKNYTVAITAYDAANPYGVYTVKHLTDVRNALDKNYKLMNNISLPEANAEGAAATGISDYATAGWLPIANEATMEAEKSEVKGGFAGTFDGGGNSIDNFYMNRTGLYHGFFAAMQATTVIKNLNIKGRANATALTAGNENALVCYVGIMVGVSMGGMIDNCSTTGDISVTGNVKGSFTGGIGGACILGNIRNSNASGNLSLTSTYISTRSEDASAHCAGGLTGICQIEINDCFANVNISAQANSLFVGGLAGINLATPIKNSYANGNITGSTIGKEATLDAGGLIGRIQTTKAVSISSSYATGNVSVSNHIPKSSCIAGGLIGESDESGVHNLVIENCFSTGDVSTTSTAADTKNIIAAGLLGNQYMMTIRNCYAEGNVSVSAVATDKVYLGGLVATKLSNIKVTNSYYNKSVIRKNNADAAPADASTQGITPKTKEEMQNDNFKDLLNGTTGSIWGRNDGKNVKLPFIVGVGVGK